MFQATFYLFFVLFIISDVAYSQDRANKDITVTKAEFSIDKDNKPMNSVVATIEEHPLHGSQYQWLILNFYSFSIAEQELAAVKNGNIKPLEDKRYEGDVNRYNNSNAKIILSINNSNKQINQVDMSVPGYACTIVWKSDDIKKFSENYSFKDNHVKIKNKDSHTCEMNNKQMVFSWDFDIDTPVFQKK